MSQYFRFVNESQCLISEVPLAINGGVDFAKNLHYYTIKDILECFNQVCLDNNWKLVDTVAVGNYGTIVSCQTGTVETFDIEGTTFCRPFYKSVWEEI